MSNLSKEQPAELQSSPVQDQPRDGGDDATTNPVDEPSPTTPAESVSSVAEEASAVPFAKPLVSRWAVHRRLYDWVLSFAHHKHSTTALFLLAFAESSFFPVPPDVLLGALCLGRRNRSLWFAFVTTIASVLGGMLGYAIGWGLWETLSPIVLDHVPGFSTEHFNTVEAWYDQWGVWILFAAAFTPIPFKVFTIAGGVFAQPFVPFILVAALGRGLRFFLVAAVFWAVGPKAVPFIDRHFNKICIIFTILLIAGFFVIKLINHMGDGAT